MYSHLTILAHSTHDGADRQSEHGALHMHWDIATVRLRPNDLLMFVRFLSRWGVSGEPNADEEWCTFSRTEQGTIQLWLGQIGMSVSQAEFTTLIDLVEHAAALLVAGESHSAPPQPKIRDCPALTIDTSAIVLN
jgi:hypothetical protein